MGQKMNFIKAKTLLWPIVLMALTTFTLSGCGTSLLGDGKTDPNTVIWKHRDQYVRLEPQDSDAGKTALNDHPASYSVEDLQKMLAAIEVIPGGGKDAVPLFTSTELDILGPAITQGLAQASPDQDVTFAIVGVHRAFVSFSNDRSVVTGRIFVENGKLNMIIGQLHEPYLEKEDRRIAPLLAGNRLYKPLPYWKEQWEIVPMAGLDSKTSNGIERYDWLIMTPDPQLWKTALAEKKEAKETARDAFREASEVRETSTQLEAEQLKLRSELQEMKQTIQELQQSPAAAPAAVKAPATQAPDAISKIEERLQTLQRLKSKGLITEQEFQAKRQEILDEI